MCDAWGLLFCSFAFMDEEEEKRSCVTLKYLEKNLQTTKPRSTNEIKKPLFSAAC